MTVGEVCAHDGDEDVVGLWLFCIFSSLSLSSVI